MDKIDVFRRKQFLKIVQVNLKVALHFKKIYTEQRSELCSDTINSLLSIKMNIDTCCYNTELSPPLLRKLKRAAMEYNEQHSSTASNK